MSARLGLDVRQRKLASELRRFREVALLTADEVAQRLGWSASKVSRVENARIRLRSDDVEQLLNLYEVPVEQRAELLELAGMPSRKRWWDVYADTLSPELLNLISFENDAVAARSFEPLIVPGLLQTEEYAREIFNMWKILSATSPIQLDRRVEARLTRQQILSRQTPLKLHVIADEAILSRQFGSGSVMRGQLHHLAEMSRAPHITLQILPLAKAHEAMAVEPFVLLDIPEFQTVLCVESLFGSRLHINDINNVSDADHVHRYSLIFDSVRAAACSVEESRGMIEQAADRWRP